MADFTIAQLETDISNIKTTVSGEVEFHSSTESMALVTEDIKSILAARGVPYCEDSFALQALAATEANIAYLNQSGLFQYMGSAQGLVSYQSVDGGYWCKFSPVTLSDLVDETGIASGKYVIWDGSKYALSIPTVSALGWANITGKPIITGTTNPAIPGNLSVGGNVAVTGTTTLTDVVSMGSNLDVTGNIHTSNQLTVDGDTTLGNVEVADAIVNGTLSVSGLLTASAGIVITGNVSTSGNVALTATAAALSMTGATASINLSGGASSIGAYVIAAAGSMTAPVIGSISSNITGLKITATQRLQIPTWANSGARPVSALNAGDCGFNLGTNSLEIYNGSAWKVVALS